jgi:hypothetical protein
MAFNFYNTFTKFVADINKREHERNYGLQGGNDIADTNPYTGRWQTIKADGAADVTFTTLTTAAGDNMDGYTLLAGDLLYGDFTNIQLSGGRIYAYTKN